MQTAAQRINEGFSGMLEEFYPGSTKPIVRHPNRLHTQAAKAADDLFNGADAKPRKYMVNGVETEFYTVGQLALALGRKAVTIRKWEREGIIPKSTFQVPGKDGDPRGRRRIYTRAQVEGIVRIAQEEGVLVSHQKPIKSTNFTARVVELFERLAT